MNFVWNFVCIKNLLQGYFILKIEKMRGSLYFERSKIDIYVNLPSDF